MKKRESQSKRGKQSLGVLSQIINSRGGDKDAFKSDGDPVEESEPRSPTGSRAGHRGNARGKKPTTLNAGC